LLPIWQAEETPDGLLRIRGEALFAGTIENGTFRRREGEWFITQDRVRVTGRTLTPQGRADFRVKVMGELIDLEAVEKRFLEFAQGSIREGSFAVIAIPDPRRENSLIAVFEGNCPEKALAAYQSATPGPERFVRWIAVESFPRTDLGKLRRTELMRICMEPRDG
jgi:acyl-CoA synthetase (AMP-forming)/AMP-acid ligase II